MEEQQALPNMPSSNVEYFYGEQLRWNYGFENPNKGAVIWACLVPLLLGLWFMAWRIRNAWLRVAALTVTGAGFLACGYFLFMSYSRGGLVAAAAGIVYVLVREAMLARKSMSVVPVAASRGKVAATVAILIAAIGLFYYVGLAERTAEGVEDASVGNRFVLWESGLQMAADNPRGVGAGESGKAFMAWYQPIERTEQYRTMVNSYLTLLIEYGYPVFFVVIALAAFLWLWTNPRMESPAANDLLFGLRGVLVAFAISGVFSTVMEEAKLWAIPGIAAGILCVWTLARRKSPVRALVGGPAFAAALCVLLLIGGWALSQRDPLVRTFASKDGKQTVASVKPRTGSAFALDLLPDARVTGEEPGKLIRQLALEGKCEVRLSPATHGEIIAVAGSGFTQQNFSAAKTIILIAPERTDEEVARKILTDSKRVVVLLPEIDEDGRTDFWTGIVTETAKDTVQQESLTGVGNDVTWAWPNVIAMIQAEAAK